jgi:hypothetical protein
VTWLGENLVRFRAFIGDSADRNREHVIVSGAVIGNEYQWRFIARKWRERLAVDEIEYFKSSHCESLNGQFRKYRRSREVDAKKKVDALCDDLNAIIRESQLLTVGVVLPVRFLQVMKFDPVKCGALRDAPYQTAFQQILAESAALVIRMGRNSIVTFGHDDGDDFHALHSLYEDFKKANPRYARVMADFVPLDEKSHLPLQVADVAVLITFRYAEDWAIDPTPENLKRLRQSMYKIVTCAETSRRAAEYLDGTPTCSAYVAAL